MDNEISIVTQLLPRLAYHSSVSWAIGPAYFTNPYKTDFQWSISINFWKSANGRTTHPRLQPSFPSIFTTFSGNMIDLVIHNLCNTWGYATDNAKQYRDHLIEHEDGSRLPSFQPLCCIQREMHERSNQHYGLWTHVERHCLLDHFNAPKTVIHTWLIQFQIEAPGHISQEQLEEHDSWPPYVHLVQNGHHAPSHEIPFHRQHEKCQNRGVTL